MNCKFKQLLKTHPGCSFYQHGKLYLKLPATVFLLLISLTLSSCISMLNVHSPAMITVRPVDVFVQSSPLLNPSRTMGITLFASPSYFQAAGTEVSTIVQQELLKRSVFRQTLIIPRTVQSGEEGVYWGQKEGCDLVMLAGIPDVFDGSGNLTTRLTLQVEIWDVRTSSRLWYFQQEAFSSPGADVDFYWTTIAGDSAVRYKVLARELGTQMADLLAVPPEPAGMMPWCL